MRRSGAMKSQRGAVDRLVRLYPGSNARELAEYSMHHALAMCLGADVTARYHAIARRLPELASVHAEDALFGRARRWYPR